MNQRTRIKFCGMTCPEDVIKASEMGVDAIGMIFYPQSPRVVTIAQAQKIFTALPPFITTVAVVVNASSVEVKKIITELPFDLIQFHGNETPNECESYNKPYIKALRVQEGMDISKFIGAYTSAKGILFDTFHPQQMGGSGQTFNWQAIPAKLNKPLLLAGGLTPENITTAIQTVRPYAVDICSGIEAMPGRKDYNKMAALIRGVKDAERD